QEKVQIAPYVLSYYPLMGMSIPFLARNLERQLDSFVNSCDIVHNIRIGREPISYASYYAALKHNIPFVFTPLHHPRWSGWLYRFYHDLYRKADALIVLTNAERNILLNFGVDERKIHVTGNGPRLAPQANGQRFRDAFHLGQDPIILFLGQKYVYKGFEALAKAAEDVWKHFPDAWFVFIGPRTRFSEHFFSEVHAHRIVEIGFVDLQEKTDALAACTILCVPSSQESFGGVYTEAWSFSKPVIGCNIPAVAEVVQDGENGIITSQEPAQIAEDIIQLLSNPGDAFRMGEAGKKKVEQNFSWPAIAQKIEDVYRALL
ncbi:MAG TPA: glycosyltransferase family 4 protein, partial [Anaerolineaceae bacterium]|nr:glycosyltransferase family 4 protein [Anaerolineaceae bacterium]